MIWLVLGLLLWIGVHLLPSLGRPVKSRIIEKVGPLPYKRMFGITLMGALALIVLGWRSSDPTLLYDFSSWSRPVGLVLMFSAITLAVASNHPSRIRQFIRHPQLISVIIWALAHLLMNGDSRSLILFGGLGLWAAAEILMINRRDGAWVKPAIPPFAIEVRGLVIVLVVYGLLGFAHGYFTGVSIIPA
jgi:uncharacterized membrane protein